MHSLYVAKPYLCLSPQILSMCLSLFNSRNTTAKKLNENGGGDRVLMAEINNNKYKYPSPAKWTSEILGVPI